MKIIIFLGVVISFSLWATDNSSEESDHQVETARGPHGGRLFKQEQWTVELTIFERGMPPHFRAYLYDQGKPADPSKAILQVELKRFNGSVDKITFLKVDDFLQSEQVINEPHSFDAMVMLTIQEKNYTWKFDSYEGRVKIAPAILKAASIETDVVKGVTLEKQLKVVGKIMPNRNASAPIYPRYSGIIKELTKNLGDEVTKGEVLVTIESNESLQNYNIVAPISGTVVQKYSTTGELAKGDKPIYEIASLADVWADLTLYRKEAPLVKQGMKVVVIGDEGKPQTVSTINYISPLGIEDSQTTLARVVLPNAERHWMPGMYVNASITIGEKQIPVAVPHSAIQRLADNDVVFVQQGDFFEATPVEIGEQDDNWIEVLSGLDPGQRYVSKNSFFLKAEIGKEGASHEH